LFFPAACTSGKIHFGLQVCRLSASGGQLVRAAGRSLLSKKSKGVFRQPQAGSDEPACLCSGAEKLSGKSNGLSRQ
ncbi:MAG: hypothetical protein MRZ24_01190, partial [Clostridiales bacterium]|nr:hypothetical protein [Clostridiales bacterium]